MRTLLTLWLCPILVFWGWYFLSLADLGGIVFSREMNERVLAIYATLLGVEPAAIPAMVAEALAVDGLVVLAIILFRRRRSIAGWWAGRRDRAAASYARKAESLSSAP